MKYLICFILLLGPIVIFSQRNDSLNNNGYNVFYYENGKKSSEGFLREGKPDGFWKTYYESGKIKSEGNRLNFELDSIWNFYDENGNIKQKISYREDHKNGYLYKYELIKDQNGIEKNCLVSKELYVNDVLTGNSFYYYPTGELQFSIYFLNGRKDDLAKEFGKDSTLITLIRYKNDFLIEKEQINRKSKNGWKQGTWKEFYPGDKLKIEAKYKNDTLNGTYREYSKDGSLISIIRYNMGKVTEEITEDDDHLDLVKKYHENGKIKYQGNYMKNIPVGIHREYDENEEIVASKTYDGNGILIADGIVDKSGKKQGKWKFYYESGSIKEEGSYSNNKKTGPWKFYYETGEIEQTGSYKNGKEDGEWKWLTKTGGLIREETYDNGLEQGVMTEYDRDGKIILQGTYQDGLRTGEWSYTVNDIIEKGEFNQDLQDGEWKYYYKEDKIYFEGKFILGNENGKHKFYWPDGTIKSEGRYLMGKKEGTWKYYLPDGNVFITITYNDGEEIKIDGYKIRSPKESKSQPQ